MSCLRNAGNGAQDGVWTFESGSAAREFEGEGTIAQVGKNVQRERVTRRAYVAPALTGCR